MSHVPVDLTQPAEPPTEPPHDLKPVYDFHKHNVAARAPPWAHPPIMQAHPQIRKPPISRDAVQHVTAMHGARISAHGQRGSCTQTTSLSTKASAASPTLHTSAPQFLLPNHMSQIPYQRPHLRTDEAQRARIPQSLCNRQKEINTTRPVPHAPDSSARIGDCRKAYDKPADVMFSWPYHYPCIAMAEIIGPADLMS